MFASFGVRPASPPPGSESARQWRIVEKVYSLVADGRAVAKVIIEKDVSAPESKIKPVAARMSEVYSSCLPDGTKPMSKRTLRQLGCPHAFCGSNDYTPDLVLVTVINDIPALSSVVDFKSSSSTVYSGFSQVAKNAEAAAVELCARGVSFEDVLIPAVCTNGLSE